LSDLKPYYIHMTELLCVLSVKQRDTNPGVYELVQAIIYPGYDIVYAALYCGLLHRADPLVELTALSLPFICICRRGAPEEGAQRRMDVK